MKLVSFIHDNHLKMGAIVNGTITIATGNMQHAESMITFLNDGDRALQTLQQLIENLWQQQGFTALLVTHDVAEAVQAARITDRLLERSVR